MIVIADTSVVCYLVLIEQIELLPQLFGQIVIPQAVYEELRAEGAPVKLQEWMRRLPTWLEIYAVLERLQQTTFRASPRLLRAIVERYQKNQP